MSQQCPPGRGTKFDGGVASRPKEAQRRLNKSSNSCNCRLMASAPRTGQSSEGFDWRGPPLQAASGERGRRGRVMHTLKTDYRLRLNAIAVMVLLCACGSRQNSSQAPALAQSDNHHIYVTSEGLDGTCYQDLGQLTLNETYAQSVVESADTQAQRLRELAREKYPAKTDAIINVREQQDEAGTTVEVVGEAVHLVNHETVACVARGMPAVVDTASAGAAGGIVGTVIGGLSQSGGSVYGAEAGGAMGATAGAGIEVAKHRQQQQAQEALIADRIEQQRKQIAQLYQQLAKLIGQQCDSEELSEQECEQRITAVQQQIAVANGPTLSSAISNTVSASPSAAAPSEFEVVNRIQEQQEVIDKLQQRIAQIKQSTDNP
jgi:hypothetical protein